MVPFGDANIRIFSISANIPMKMRTTVRQATGDVLVLLYDGSLQGWPASVIERNPLSISNSRSLVGNKQQGVKVSGQTG